MLKTHLMTPEQPNPKHTVRRWVIPALAHTFATFVLGAALALLGMNVTQMQMVWYSATQQGMPVDYAAVALHFGLAGCVWALFVIGFKLVQLRRSEKKQKKRILLSSRGTVLTETLIVIVPFLLLTSGIAQLTQVLVTGILCDLAVFQAARAVFVWAPETTQPRFESAHGSTIIRDRARTIASMTVAPTAPADYTVGRIPAEGSSDYFRRQRNVMVGAFRLGTPGSNWLWSASNPAAGAWGLDALQSHGEDVTFARAFDSVNFGFRAARKMTQAEWGMWHEFQTICPQNCDTSDGDRAGVHFTYWYNIVLPWFGYIWGDYEVVGMRGGYYSKIERRHTFPSLPMPN